MTPPKSSVVSSPTLGGDTDTKGDTTRNPNPGDFTPRPPWSIGGPGIVP